MNKMFIGLVCGIASAALATSASAQVEAEQGSQPGTSLKPATLQDAPATDPADRQQTVIAAASQNTVADIVVTANRRSENLQNVPVSVVAVGAEALTNAGVANVQDLKTVVPGLNVINDTGYISAHLRGIGSTAPGPSVENAIAIYVDGVYYASTAGANLNFVDVADVEVLKGPQGTLFGRNATGGLIQVTTRDPSQTPKLDVDIGYGNYQTLKGDVYASGGLADNLAGSIAVQVNHQGEGYGRNFFTGKYVNQTDHDVSSRAKLLWTPSDETKITANLDYSDNRNSDGALTLYPGTLPGPGTGPVRTGSPYDIDSEAQPLTATKTGGASLKVIQDLPFAQVSNIAAYRATSVYDTFDVDSTPTPYEVLTFDTREHQLSEEFQLQSLRGSKLNWTTGLYYFNEDGRVDPFSIALRGGPGVNPNYPIDGITEYGDQKVTSVAAYGQASLLVLPKTNLTIGARYTYERHRIVGTETGAIGGVTVATFANIDNAKSFSKPTFRVSLDHRFSAEVLAYASFNTGFKSGGYDPFTITSGAYSPETLTAYEGGLKTNLLHNHIRANIAFFYYSYKNIQEQRLVNGATGIQNGAAARTYGIDFDFDARVTSALSVHGGIEYLHDRFTSFPDAVISNPLGVAPVSVGSARGNKLPFAPDAVIDFGVDYKIKDVAGGDLHLNATYQYNTGFSLEVDNVIRQPSYSEINASIRWKSQGGRYSAALWGNNLSNVTVATFVASETFGDHQAEFAAPRTFGITLGYHY